MMTPVAFTLRPAIVTMPKRHRPQLRRPRGRLGGRAARRDSLTGRHARGAADTLTISHAARNDPRFDALAFEDRLLSLALLSYSDSLHVYITVHGHRQAIGQHRICAARTAGVTHLPVSYDRRSQSPPAPHGSAWIDAPHIGPACRPIPGSRNY